MQEPEMRRQSPAALREISFSNSSQLFRAQKRSEKSPRACRHARKILRGPTAHEYCEQIFSGILH
jgi:hypothetical protein